MKKVLNFIFIIIFAVSLLGFGTLSITRGILNNETSKTKRSELTTGVGATYEIKGEDKLVTYAEIENIDSVNIDIAHQYLDADLTKQKIPTDALEYVLAEDDYQGMYYEYRASAIGYLKGQNDKPTLEIDRILAMVDRGLTKYNAEKGTNLPVESIKSETKKVADGIDTQIEKLKSNKALTKVLQVATSNKLYYGSIIMLLISLVALLIINGIVEGLKKIGVGFIIGGLFSLIISFAVKSDIFSKLKELASMVIKYISNKSLTFGIVYIVIGIVLIVISVLIKTSLNKKVVKEAREIVREEHKKEVEKVEEKEETKEPEEEVTEEVKEEKKPVKKNNKKKSNK